MTKNKRNTWIPDQVWEKETGMLAQLKFIRSYSVSKQAKSKYFKINNHTPLVVPDSDLRSMHFIFLLCFSSIIQPHDFNIISIQDILIQRPDIEYIKCHDAQPFEYKPFPISRFPELQPNKGILAETFIAKIPNGQVCSWHGWIKIDNNIIQNFIFPYATFTGQKDMLKYFKFNNIKKIAGKVAVITMPFDNCYGHWMINILGRLALLQLHNIDYDWLYVSTDQPFMRETLALCGVDPAKIISPFGQNYYIQADELIVPSHACIINPQLWTPLCGYYLSPWIINYLQTKFLPIAQNSTQPFCKKVFISRKNSSRHMTNEDEIFALFKPLGFKRYFLENMSLQEQITLFHNATTIIATNGSSLTNQLFCKPNTNIIEIFLARSDATFYYASEVLKLNQYCIKTKDFHDAEGSQHAHVDPAIMYNFITHNAYLFESNTL